MRTPTLSSVFITITVGVYISDAWYVVRLGRQRADRGQERNQERGADKRTNSVSAPPRTLTSPSVIAPRITRSKNDLRASGRGQSASSVSIRIKNFWCRGRQRTPPPPPTLIINIPGDESDTLQHDVLVWSLRVGKLNREGIHRSLTPRIPHPPSGTTSRTRAHLIPHIDTRCMCPRRYCIDHHLYKEA